MALGTEAKGPLTCHFSARDLVWHGASLQLRFVWVLETSRSLDRYPEAPRLLDQLHRLKKTLIVASVPPLALREL